MERNLLEEWRHINIHFDYSNLKTTNKDIETYIKNTIIKKVQSKLQKLIMIKGSGIIGGFTDGCSEIQVSEDYQNPTTSDLIIFVFLYQDEDPNAPMAGSAPCALQKSDNRPIIGKIRINESKLQIGKDNINRHIDLIIHEMMHVLVMSPPLFDVFPINGNVVERYEINGQEKVRIVTQKVLEEAQNHFGCFSLVGVELENQGSNGSAGAHWELKEFGDELMTSEIQVEPKLSRITLGLLEDSSWYKIDYNLANRFFWGRKKGCKFFDEICDKNFGEFCENSSLNCSVDFRAKTQCKVSDFSNSCHVNVKSKKFVCTNKETFQQTSSYEVTGMFSRCFITESQNGILPGCYSAQCQNGRIHVTVDDEVYYCDKKGDSFRAGHLEVFCPDVEVFCDYLYSGCLEDCNANGVCLSNKSCQCDYFYKGLLCDSQQGCQLGDEEICDLLEQNIRTFDVNVDDGFIGILVLYLNLTFLLVF